MIRNTKRLEFTNPAHTMTESLPLGNGRLGALIYGEVMREQIVLNESSMWSGSPQQSDRTDAIQYLPEIRRLLAEGKNYEAEQLFAQHFTCIGKGSNYARGAVVPFGCYQILGRLHLSYFQAISGAHFWCDGVKNYKRSLNMETGEVKVSFEVEGITFEREYLVAEDPNALCIRLSASEKGILSVGIGIDRDERFAVETKDDHTIVMHGQLSDGRDDAQERNSIGTKDKGEELRELHDNGDSFCYEKQQEPHVSSKSGSEEPLNSRDVTNQNAENQSEESWKTEIQNIEEKSKESQSTASHGIHYICAVSVNAQGGRTYTDSNRIYVKDADEILLTVTARTDLHGFMDKEAPKNLRDEVLAENKSAIEKSWSEIQETHRKATSAALGRLELHLDENCGTEARRLEQYVNYSRYLLHSCSRKDSFPANLQGIWADEIQTPWNADWHLNAQQMIYWLAEKGNLSEDHIPYLRLTENLVKPGEKTAKAYYGAEGWLAHTCANPWGFTSPMEDAAWGSTTGSPAWLCHHLWEHYLYTKDNDYLGWAYPVMKGAAQFYKEMLVEDKKHGWLVTSPSSSPENAFLDKDGHKCSLCEGPAYDRELVASLFDACIQSQYVLKNDTTFVKELTDCRKRLAPIEIASDGRIMEWGEEYPEAYKYHRHLSHLWGAYPGQMINYEHTPNLAAAAEKSLKMRGRSTVGWAIAYRMALWARLRNGDEAYSYISNLFDYATGKNLFNLAYHCDETVDHPELPDLDNCRYPFQIDGNQGAAAAILLMLLDDFARVREDGTMETELILLPALPKALHTGCVRGICAKGGITVDIEWKDGGLTDAVFHAEPGTEFTLRYGKKTAAVKMDKSIVHIQEIVQKSGVDFCDLQMETSKLWIK